MLELTPVLIVGIIFGSVVLLVKISSEYKTKNNLINKGLVDEKIKFLYNKPVGNYAKSNVKWGMILIGIGLALALEEFIHLSDETMLGLMFLFAGAAFLIYYVMVKNDGKENKQE